MINDKVPINIGTPGSLYLQQCFHKDGEGGLHIRV